MMRGKIKVAIITNIIPTYRKGFYDRLFLNNSLETTVYCQSHICGMNIIPIHKNYDGNVRIVKFISAKNEKISWQFLPWIEIIKKYDVVYVSGNPRCLSDLFFSVFLKIIGKRVVLWTMACSYRGKKTTEYIRLQWARIFPMLFLYTDKEADYLRKKGFKNHFMLGMNNGLDQNKIDQVIQQWTSERLSKWMENNGYKERIMLLSSARLDPKNRFDVMMKALPNIIKKVPNIQWCLIGDGTESYALKKLANDLKLESHVSFVGSLYEEEELAPYFLSSSLFVHPAAIGLSILHAFGYGLPVITHGETHLHNPEYAAFTNGQTGMNFIKDDPDSLAEVIIKMINSPQERNMMKENVTTIAREQYNVGIMVERFVEMSKYAANRKGLF